MYPHRKPLISLFRNNDQTLRNGQSDKAEYAINVNNTFHFHYSYYVFFVSVVIIIIMYRV